MIFMEFRRFLTECGRVLRVTKKPNKQEFWTIVKVSAIGILLIGLIGFSLRMVERYFSLLVAGILVIGIVLFLLYYKRE